MFVQLLVDDASCIATVFHAIIQGGYGLGITIVVFINDTVDAVLAVIAVSAIDTVGTFDDVNICGRTVLAVDAYMAVCTVFAILAGGGNGYAILAVLAFYANRTVDAVLTVCTFAANGEGVGLEVLIHGDDQIALIDDGFDIFRAVGAVFFCARTLDGHGFVQLFGCTAGVAGKLQAVVEGSYLMVRLAAIDVGNAGQAVCASHTSCAFIAFQCQGIGAVSPAQADSTVFDGNGRAVFAMDVDGAVNAIRARFTEDQVVIDVDLERICRCACTRDVGILAISHLRSVLSNFVLELADVDGICTGCPGSDVVNLVATVIEATAGQADRRLPCARILWRDCYTLGVDDGLISCCIGHGRACAGRNRLVAGSVGSRHAGNGNVVIQGNFYLAVIDLSGNVFAVTDDCDVFTEVFVHCIAIFCCQAKALCRQRIRNIGSGRIDSSLNIADVGAV